MDGRMKMPPIAALASISEGVPSWVIDRGPVADREIASGGGDQVPNPGTRQEPSNEGGQGNNRTFLGLV